MPDSQVDLSPNAIDAFLAKTLEDPRFTQSLVDKTGLAQKAATDLLSDLAGEARLACRLLSTMSPHHGSRVLEVGSGCGVVAAYLYGQGVDLVAIEPIVDGYEAFLAVRSLLAERVAMPDILPLAAEQLDSDEHGQFDLIFSINVLEHMQPLERNLDALTSVLAPGGHMIHTCPNYLVPYEPHFQVPLVPFAPGLTKYIARKASQDPVWKTLNWIDAGDIRRLGRRHGLQVRFRQGEFTVALQRLSQDAAFARRHSGSVIKVLRGMDKVGLARLLSRAPASWLTPMTFTISRP
jgi:2-polyprenyl-3-methyl-5-hydroxy-6-metoxy-1,4-benzoquinol methylase